VDKASPLTGGLALTIGVRRKREVMYTQYNFPTKKALREAVTKGEMVGVFQPGPFGPDVPDGDGVVEGPHGYHKWYASVTVEGGRIVKFKG